MSDLNDFKAELEQTKADIEVEVSGRVEEMADEVDTQEADDAPVEEADESPCE